MLSGTAPQDEVIIACDPNAVTPEQQEYWAQEIVPKLYGAVQEIQELPNGYAWRLPSDPEILPLVAADLNLERLCCPFVNYTLELEPNKGPFWLRMTGGEGVKAFLRMAFESSLAFDPQVAKAAGLNNFASPEIDSVETAIEVINGVNERFSRSIGSGDQ